jgi:hypothetical protein
MRQWVSVIQYPGSVATGWTAFARLAKIRGMMPPRKPLTVVKSPTISANTS